MLILRFSPALTLALACSLTAAAQTPPSPQPTVQAAVVATRNQAPPPDQQKPSAITTNLSAPRERTLRQLGMVDIPGSPGFDEVAIANGKVLLTHTSDSSLEVVDPVRRRVVARIINLQSPRGIAVDPANQKVYVAQAGNSTIAAIAFEGWKVTNIIPVPQPPTALQLDDSGRRLFWASAQSNTLSIMDLSTRQNTGTIDLAGRPRGMAWDQERGVVFITLQDTAEVVAVDPKLQIVSRFKLNGAQPTEIVYDARTRHLYIAVRQAVLAISDENGSESSRVEAPIGVDGLWFDPESRTLYAASPGQLTVIRTTDGSLTALDKIPCDIKGHNIAYDHDSNILFLPGGREGRSEMLLLQPTSSESANGKEDVAARVK